MTVNMQENKERKKLSASWPRESMMKRKPVVPCELAIIHSNWIFNSKVVNKLLDFVKCKCDVITLK